LRRAFTLIELLVVIAIIAILAAILFPVFAQAKQAAKGSASLSNTKQISLGIIQYCADYDDNFPLTQTWYVENRLNGYQITQNPGNIPFNPWRSLVHPYIKNFDLYKDPTASGVTQNSNYAAAPFLNNVMYGQYGYNFMFLSPMVYNGTYLDSTSVSATAPANPADTVMLVQQYTVFTDATQNWGSVGLRFSYIGMVDAPDCDSTPSSNLCEDNWGMNGAWESLMGLKEQFGGRTGGVSARLANGANTAFTDGHVKRFAVGALAAGTNWSRTRTSATTGIIPAQIDKYIWDLL